MVRVLVGMVGMVGIGFFLIFIAYIADRGANRQQSIRKQYKKLQEDFGKVTLELANRDELINTLDKAAQAEYIVNEHNTFAANVSDTIARAASPKKKKQRALT